MASNLVQIGLSSESVQLTDISALPIQAKVALCGICDL